MWLGFLPEIHGRVPGSGWVIQEMNGYPPLPMHMLAVTLLREYRGMKQCAT